MDDSEERDKKTAYTLLGILQDYAPNGTAQARCSELFNQSQRDGATQQDLVRIMTNCLHDGLKYGNWPWIVVNPLKET